MEQERLWLRSRPFGQNSWDGSVTGCYFGQDNKEVPHRPRAQDPTVPAQILQAREAAEAK